MSLFIDKISASCSDKHARSALLILFLCIFSLSCKASDVTVMIGGALHTCSSLSAKNCQTGAVPQGKKSPLYKIDNAAIKRLEKAVQFLRQTDPHLPHLQIVVRRISQLAISPQTGLTKRALLAAWDEAGKPYSDQLSDSVYYALLDSLEIPQSAEVVAVEQNRSAAALRIVERIRQLTERAGQGPGKAIPRLLVVTAASRDPYESVDFYEQLFTFERTETQWLPLTPALAEASTQNDCAKLDIYRQRHNTFAREHVYPVRTQQEALLCEAGISGIVNHISSATTIMFNGGDQSLIRKVLFNKNGEPYPWTETLRQRPVIAGTSAGTAIQSGGENVYGKVPIVSNGSAVEALTNGAFAGTPPSQRCQQECQNEYHPDALTYHPEGGLGRVNAGIMDTHFSERDRTLRLHVLIRDSGQHFGYGVDETTALIIDHTKNGPGASVEGEHGVVKVKADTSHGFIYSYYPQGTPLKITDNQINMSPDSNSDSDEGPTSQGRLKTDMTSLLSDANLRRLTQQMCRQRKHNARASHRSEKQVWKFVFDARAARYADINSSDNGCAIEGMRVSYKKTADLDT